MEMNFCMHEISSKTAILQKLEQHKAPMSCQGNCDKIDFFVSFSPEIQFHQFDNKIGLLKWTNVRSMLENGQKHGIEYNLQTDLFLKSNLNSG